MIFVKQRLHSFLNTDYDAIKQAQRKHTAGYDMPRLLFKKEIQLLSVN